MPAWYEYLITTHLHLILYIIIRVRLPSVNCRGVNAAYTGIEHNAAENLHLWKLALQEIGTAHSALVVALNYDSSQAGLSRSLGDSSVIGDAEEKAGVGMDMDVNSILDSYHIAHILLLPYYSCKARASRGHTSTQMPQPSQLSRLVWRYPWLSL